ncbi:unnamed protein product [Victoria cruziana]
MHLIQGDRRFSQWKGSVVDSVVGVFLTQNVSDHLSSSAFMSLAAQFPKKEATIHSTLGKKDITISLEMHVARCSKKSGELMLVRVQDQVLLL